MRVLPILLAALLPATAVAKAPTDWTRTVTLAPGGSYVLGDARAPRLVEYVSYTCSHCAHFVAEASPVLRSDWVAKGRLSVEVRNAIRDPYDLTAAVLARCGGPARFFANHEALFANQSAWMEKIQPYEAARGDKPAPKDTGAQLAAIAAGTGLTDFMARRGVSPEKQRACFADKGTLATLSAMAKDAWEVKKIGGTPSFSLRGATVDDVHDWDNLQSRLNAAPVAGKTAFSTALPAPFK